MAEVGIEMSGGRTAASDKQSDHKQSKHHSRRHRDHHLQRKHRRTASASASVQLAGRTRSIHLLMPDVWEKQLSAETTLQFQENVLDVLKKADGACAAAIASAPSVEERRASFQQRVQGALQEASTQLDDFPLI